jgi:hypothetical protein
MTTFADRFVAMTEDEDGVAYHWMDWEIYWDYVGETGQLYDPDGYCVGTGDTVEELAAAAVEMAAAR